VWLSRPGDEGLLAGEARAQLIGVAWGLVISLGFVALSLSRVPASDLWDSLRRADAWPWLPMGSGFYLVGHLIRGWRSRMLMMEDARTSLAEATNIVVVGYAANNVLPARLGEFVRAALLVDRTGLSVAQALSVTLVERLLDALAIVLLLALSAVAGAVVLDGLLPAATLLAAACLSALALLVLLPDTILAGARWLIIALGRWLPAPTLRLLQLFLRGAAGLREGSAAVGIVASSLIIWLLESAMFFCALPAVGARPSMVTATLAMSVTNLGLLVPSSPGYIGPFHYFCARALELQGVASEQALVAAVLTHAMFFVPVTLWGGAVAIAYGASIGRSWRSIRRAKAASDAPSDLIPGAQVIAVLGPAQAPPEPGPFMLMLTEALVEDALTRLPPAERDAAIRHAARFTLRQMHALPPLVSALFRVGMAGFRLAIRAWTRRGFCDLPLAERAAIVRWWAYGPVSLTRQLFRAPRSTALLAVYEVPGTTAAP
jgi:uncharacterized membrane protein YbhN (UPF0104 family)